MTTETTHFEPQAVAPLGEINITTGVLEAIAAKAASDVKGVYRLHTNFQTEVGGLFGMSSERVGAKVRRSESEIAIDVVIDMKYGYAVPEVATKVQQKVKEQILFMTDLVVQEVNVHVASIETEPTKKVEYLHLDEENGDVSE